jgi:large subunit ribosomal protein L10
MAAAAEKMGTGHPAEPPTRARKKEAVKTLSHAISQHSLVAVVGIRGVPAPAIQSMRKELRSAGTPMQVAPNTLIGHALEAAGKSRPALKKLEPHVKDQCAILLSNANPFILYQSLERTRQPAAARGGEIAPKDIQVHAGETSFKPGPIVGELQHAGFPAAIEKGKVVMKKDATIVPKGKVISREVATMLSRLEIFPLEVGLMLRGAVEGDLYYPRESLAVDFDQMRADLGRAHRQALGVALELAWPAPETLPLILARAHRQARSLAVEGAFPTPETVEALFIKAERQARAVEKLQSK